MIAHQVEKNLYNIFFGRKKKNLKIPTFSAREVNNIVTQRE